MRRRVTKKRVILEAGAYLLKFLIIDLPLSFFSAYFMKRRFLKGLKTSLKPLPSDLRREILWEAKRRAKLKGLIKSIMGMVRKEKNSWLR